MPSDGRDAIPGLEGSEVTRRKFLGIGAQAGIGTVALAASSSAFLAACSKDNKAKVDSNANRTGSTDALKIGVVAPFSGLGAFIGTITRNSLEAAVEELNAEGGLGGRKIELELRDTGAETTNGPKVYTELAAMDGIVGILWCGGLGFTQTLPQIKRDGLPLIAVFNDVFSADRLYPGKDDQTGRSVFQMLLPDTYAKEILGKYAAEDRGYKTVAHMYNSDLDPDGQAKKNMETHFTKAGMEVVTTEIYRLSDAEYGAQLQRIKAKRPDVLYVDGLSSNTAGIVKALAELDASYVDTPTAKGTGAWHPHFFGSPGGAGDKSWVELAGTAAKVGSVTAWHVGGLVYLPTFAIGGWMRKHLQKNPTGGEESPADGLRAILAGVEKGGSTDREKVVSGIETSGRLKFASIEFGFTKDRHLSKTIDDITVITMERGASGPARTDPAYEVGKEWTDQDGFGRTPAGPTQLVRPTLKANQRAHPEVMEQVVDDGYGTHCTKKGGSLTADCKIH